MDGEFQLNNDGLPHLGLIGAGRLAEVITKVWLARTGGTVTVWSRGGKQSPESKQDRIVGGTWVNDWWQTLTTDAVIVAIPGAALLELARDCEPARVFRGRLYCAALSLSQEALQQAFPHASVIRIAPFLIDEDNSIPMLVFRPPTLADPIWTGIESELGNLGEIDITEDEKSFDQLTLLGSPWPVVVNAAIGYAANIGVRGLRDDDARLGRRLFFKAMQSFISVSHDKKLEPAEAIATPGGVTERGLQHIKALDDLLNTVFSQMLKRAEELRVGISKKNNQF